MTSIAPLITFIWIWPYRYFTALPGCANVTSEFGPVHLMVKLLPETGPVIAPFASSLKDAFCLVVKVAIGSASVGPTTSPANI
ncbi:unannotated protein [freshwater metagenome]|uniref:Unannotated protein n=1 Tax=freshwater metagenome TaxID=449393 RepID=A0A6J7NC39_9ZZZZ